MGKQRRQFSEQFKFKVALEAAKGLRTVNEIASEYQVHPNQVSSWKKQRLDNEPGVFSRSRERKQVVAAEQEVELYTNAGIFYRSTEISPQRVHRKAQFFFCAF